jgi:hypothetical protein
MSDSDCEHMPLLNIALGHRTVRCTCHFSLYAYVNAVYLEQALSTVTCAKQIHDKRTRRTITKA